MSEREKAEKGGVLFPFRGTEQPAREPIDIRTSWILWL